MRCLARPAKEKLKKVGTTFSVAGGSCKRLRFSANSISDGSSYNATTNIKARLTKAHENTPISMSGGAKINHEHTPYDTCVMPYIKMIKLW